MTTVLSILAAILMFSLVIFVHELGHFLFAKLFRIQVNEFSMFMGPAIVKWQRGETLYAIRCIPIGGYCAMEGEDGESENPRAFSSAAWWKRLCILAAGPLTNILLGFLIFILVFLPNTQIATPVITDFSECCTFHGENGLQVGDEILQIDGENIYVQSDISMLFNLSEDGVHDITVLRDGARLEFKDLDMRHVCKDENGKDTLHYGIYIGQTVPLDPLMRLQHAWNLTIDNIRTVRLSLQMLFTGKAGVQDVTGVVGLVGIMTDVAATSPTVWDAFLNLLYFSGFIAVNLGVMNLLPIPALDGGRIVALLLTTVVEGITKKKLNPKYEAYLHGAGMVLLLILMAVVLFKDVIMIFAG